MKIRDACAKMRADIRSAYKSEDTEEFFDRIFTKPLGYLFALLFMKLNWTPNMVTMLSMGIGFVGGLLFYPENLMTNIIGVILVIIANILDSTDGQIARLTGHKSTLGRILDALSTSTWYIAIYLALGFRLMDEPIPFTGGEHLWGGWIFVIIVLSALLGHQRQCMLADYYRNIHLHFLKNKNGGELDRSDDIARQRAALSFKGNAFQCTYLMFYGLYTSIQQLSTPKFQKMYKSVGGVLPDGAREDYLKKSRKYLPLTNILTFNARAYTLFALLLLGVPILYFPIELFAFGTLSAFMRRRYEQIAHEVYTEHALPGSDQPPVKKKLYTIVFFLIGMAGIALMLWQFDISTIEWMFILRLMPVWLPMLLALWALIYLVHALAYKVIIGEDAKKLKLRLIYKLVISGFAINQVTPIGLMGGEPYRVMELKPYIGIEKATASTLLFTVMHVFSHLMFWLTGAIVYFALFGFGGGFIRTFLMALLFVISLACCVLFFIGGRGKLVRGTLTLISKIPRVGEYVKRFMEKNAESLEDIDREVSLFHARVKSFALTVFLEYLTRLMEACEFLLIFRLLGANLTYAQSLLTLVCASALGNLLFFVPMQLGSREGGIALSIGWFGISGSLGVTATLLARIRELFYIVFGVGMILVGGGDVSAHAQASPERAPETISEPIPESAPESTLEPVSEFADDSAPESVLESVCDSSPETMSDSSLEQTEAPAPDAAAAEPSEPVGHNADEMPGTQTHTGEEDSQ